MKKKIIYLSNSVIPSKFANSVHVLRMCQALQKSGFAVELLCYTTSKNVKTSEVLIQYGIREKLEINFIFIRTTRAKFFFNFLKIFRFLFLNKKNSLIYGRDPYSVYLAALMGYKVCYESHGIPISNLFRFVERKLSSHRNLKKFIVISSKLKDLYIENNIFDGDLEIEVLHDAADPIDTPKPKNLGPGINVGYVGSLYYEGRGINIILEIAKERLDINFHLVGGNKEELDYWSQIASKNIFFHGYIDNSLVGEYLKAFDIVLMPYQLDLNLAGMKYNTIEWMSPMKMFEYMSAECAIVSSDLPVIREILNENNSILVDPSNIDEWRSAIDTLSGSTEIIRKLSSQAKTDFENKHTWIKRSYSLDLGKYF